MRNGTVSVGDIKFEPKLYPRAKWSTSTIERYADAMRAGEEFPPVALQEGTGILLDGVHRWKAKQLVDPDGNLACEHHEVPEGVPVKLYAASLSVRHGDSLSTADRKALATELVEANPEFNTVTLAKHLAVSDETVRSYVGHILAKRREERASKADRLARLGWTQKEIAEALGVSQQAVSLDLPKIQEVGELVNHQLASGHSIDEVATRHGLSLTHTWAIKLDGMDDAERLDELEIGIRPYDVWNFPKCHDLMGDKHPGRIPGELVCHVLSLTHAYQRAKKRAPSWRPVCFGGFG